jgi:hypothetical protein
MSNISICLIEEYERMNKKCSKSWACPVGAAIFLGFSAACTAFGLIGIFKNYSPEVGYSSLFILGLLGDSIVIPSMVMYLLGYALSRCYSLPMQALPPNLEGIVTGSSKPTIKVVDSSSPVEVDSPIKIARGTASPQRKRSA